ncbi:MAG TPA: ketosteroid isomerase [Blastocatellia bacterium]|nr:ketosteroid isomerase [Blastocatellia bacterium]
MSEQSNTAIVKRIYEAFGRGDIEAILINLADDVEWVVSGRQDGIPYAGTYHSRNGARDFFSLLGESISYDQFEPRRFVAEADHVAVFGYYHGNVKTNGQAVETNWAMEWTLKDDKVTSFTVYDDTAAVAAAFAMATPTST